MSYLFNKSYFNLFYLYPLLIISFLLSSLTKTSLYFIFSLLNFKYFKFWYFLKWVYDIITIYEINIITYVLHRADYPVINESKRLKKRLFVQLERTYDVKGFLIRISSFIAQFYFVLSHIILFSNKEIEHTESYSLFVVRNFWPLQHTSNVLLGVCFHGERKEELTAVGLFYI